MDDHPDVDTDFEDHTDSVHSVSTDSFKTISLNSFKSLSTESELEIRPNLRQHHFQIDLVTTMMPGDDNLEGGAALQGNDEEEIRDADVVTQREFKVLMEGQNELQEVMTGMMRMFQAKEHQQIDSINSEVQ